MTKKSKDEVDSKIDRMQPEASTNLWAGITAGLELFEPKNPVGRVPALMVLTDGQPNLL
jgi:Mg-chelatase subunit ChlD